MMGTQPQVNCLLGDELVTENSSGHADFPFKEEIYRKRPESNATIIPHYQGHCPRWQRTYGKTMGAYSSAVMTDFLNRTREAARSPRVKTPSSTISAMPESQSKEETKKLYDSRGFIPGTMLYVRGNSERFGQSSSSLSRQALQEPVVKLWAPLTNPADGKTIDHLSLHPSYGGFVPRCLPAFYTRRTSAHHTEVAEDAQEQGEQEQLNQAVGGEMDQFEAMGLASEE
eukprot:763336-Hanusia_phi.AAC.2